VLKECIPSVLQAAQRQLQQQLEAAEQLQQDIEQLKTENLETWQQKYELEGQLATARANMEGMQGQASSMQKVRMR
jgi:septal ring factor EnvC (AmiA/AmiB activator)